MFTIWPVGLRQHPAPIVRNPVGIEDFTVADPAAARAVGLHAVEKMRVALFRPDDQITVR